MKYIKLLQNINKKDLPIVGGKGANLGEMLQAGFHVPNGFCITVDAFDEFMRQFNPDNETLDWDTFQSDVISAKMPNELEHEIAECYTALGQNTRVAVRSSATAEDLPEASFAGQQETYLNIVGEDQLFVAVKKCFASLYSERAITYRKQANFDKVKVSLAVVVQEMVESEVSGVLFTEDPIHQNKGQMMLNASWGLGEAIVSGKVTPDIYIYNKVQQRISSKRLGEKNILIQYGALGVVEITTPAQKKQQFCLTPKQAIQIFKLGHQVEQHYGSPQDIEWAISKDSLYILQARPITTLDATEQSHDKLSKSQKAVINNWIEHYPTPPYPLDVEPCNIVDQAKSKVLHELGILIDGGLSMDEKGLISFSTERVHLRLAIIKLPFTLRSFINYKNNYAVTTYEFQNITKELAEIAATDFTQLSIQALIKQLNQTMNLSEKIAYVRFRYNIFPSIIIFKLLQSTLHKADKNLNEYDLLSNLQYKTWELNIALSKLAIYIQKDDVLKGFIDKQEIMNNAFIARIQGKFPSFSAKLQEFLSQFGWKSTSAYHAFSSVSWMEDSSTLFSLLKILIQSDNQVSSNSKYNDIMEKINQRFSAKKASKVYKRIEAIRTYHIHREESLYLIEMCYGLARKIVFQLSQKIPNAFEQKNDILFLTLAEVYELPNNIHKVKETIKLRKENRYQNEKLWNSLTFGAKLDESYTLTGISGNRGITQGRVKKILSIDEFNQMEKGDILVCRYTDPSWTPLFLLASAVVADTGGPLSHSAIVAREYNIPAVLGCGNATSILNDGEVIIVDGDSGKVYIKATS